MVTYEFIGEDCPLARAGKCKLIAKDAYTCRQVLNFLMKEVPPVGATVPCHCEGGVLTRIFSVPNAIVRGSNLPDWNPGESLMTRVNGQDVRLSFVDHPGGDPKLARRLEGAARRAGVSQKGLGIGKAYMNEKHGRMCVDVVSNIPDPLGAIERAKRNNAPVVQKIAVNDPYRVRRPRGRRSGR